MRIAIMTDSNSGISQEEAGKLGITVLPMPFYIDGELYREGISLSQEMFYSRMVAGADITTSQPAPGEVMEAWDALLAKHDEVLYLPMSRGLSSSCESAIMLAESYKGRVQVVDNLRLSVTQRQAVLDAIALSERGMSAAEIRLRLEAAKRDANIFVIVDTLKYLKKGGRISPAAAAIGTLLSIKPVLQIHDGRIDAYAKCRGKKAAKQMMIDALRKDLEARFPEALHAGKIHLMAAYSANPENIEEALAWKWELERAFPGLPVHMDPVTMSVACHGGPGALAVAYSVAIHES